MFMMYFLRNRVAHPDWQVKFMKAPCSLTRRQFLKTSAALGAVVMSARPARAVWPLQFQSYPKVGIERCRRYDYELVRATLAKLFDGIGDIPALVKGKTVTIKVNLTSYMAEGVYTLSSVETVHTHPVVVLAACSLFQEYGSRRMIICESFPSNDETLQAFNNHKYDVALFQSQIQNLEWENTRNLGSGSRYSTLSVGEGAYLFNSFDLNYRYAETDVMVSIAKMKNHDIAGITLSMKNLFGITPNSLYADPGNERATKVRTLLHDGTTRPAADGEIQPVTSHDPGFRVPRIVTDICRARPIDLAIIDAIVTMTGGEGAWNGLQTGIAVPNLLIAGTNCVSTDAVTASVMGYDPHAADRTKPFYNCSNILRLAADRNLGTNDLDQIEVIGLSIEDARYFIQPGLDRG